METLIFGSFHREGADSYVVNIVVYFCDALHLLRDFIQVFICMFKNLLLY